MAAARSALAHVPTTSSAASNYPANGRPCVEWREVKGKQNHLILHNSLVMYALRKIKDGSCLPFSAFREITGKNKSEASWAF
jgi:hypothetical protein